MTSDERPFQAKIGTFIQGCVVILDLAVWGAWTAWGHSLQGIMLSGAVFFPVFVLCVTSTVGLWKGRMFGWVTGLLGSGLFTLVLLITAGPLCIFPAGALMFLLSRNVREFYLQNYYE
jgi:hypothetical protein